MSYMAYDRRVRQHVVQLGSKYCFEDLRTAVDAAVRDLAAEDLDQEDVEVEVEPWHGSDALVISIRTGMPH